MAHDQLHNLSDASVHTDPKRATAVLAETIPRWTSLVSSGSLTSGTLHLVDIWIPAGTTVSNITFLSGSVALATGTHGWFALFDSARNLLAYTADDTTITWPINTLKTYAVTKDSGGGAIANYVVSTAGHYYIGVCQVATTTANLASTNSVTSALTALVPVLCGDSTAGLTTTPPNPAALLTQKAWVPLAYIT